MKKAVALLMTASLMGTMLAGCGGSDSGSGSADAAASGSGDQALSGTITLATNEDGAELWGQIIERFHAEYPDI